MNNFCYQCYFRNSNDIYCRQGLPHWAYRLACDKFKEVKLDWSKTTTTTSNKSSSITTTTTISSTHYTNINYTVSSYPDEVD